MLAGATAPGVPFLVIGHNGHIAWTFTTTGADTQDVFVETPRRAAATRPRTARARSRCARSASRCAASRTRSLTVRETRHGPVISDLDATGPILAVAMANLAPGDTAAAGLLALNRAQTCGGRPGRAR